MMPLARSLRRGTRAVAAAAMIAAVRLYQWTLSPFLGRFCRFQPTCSQYFIEAVRKYGPWRGAAKGLWRIMGCPPFGGSGYAPP